MVGAADAFPVSLDAPVHLHLWHMSPRQLAAAHLKPPDLLVFRFRTFFPMWEIALLTPGATRKGGGRYALLCGGVVLLMVVWVVE